MRVRDAGSALTLEVAVSSVLPKRFVPVEPDIGSAWMVVTKVVGGNVVGRRATPWIESEARDPETRRRVPWDSCVHGRRRW